MRVGPAEAPRARPARKAAIRLDLDVISKAGELSAGVSGPGNELALLPALTSIRASAPAGNVNRAMPARSVTVSSTRTPLVSVTA